MVSLNSETFQDSGLLDDVTAELTECSFVLNDYNGALEKPQPSFKSTLVSDDLDDPIDQFWSCGDSKYFVPSDDGDELIPCGRKTAMNKNCNAAVFFERLQQLGFPAHILDQGKASQLNGAVLHLEREVIEDSRSSFRRPQTDNANEPRERSVLVPTEIISLPGESKTGKKAGRKSAAAKTSGKKTAAASDNGLVPELEGIVMEVIEEAQGKPVRRGRLATLIFNRIEKDNPNKNALVKMARDVEFLGQDGHPWNYDAEKDEIS